jgi:hypothetical protein
METASDAEKSVARPRNEHIPDQGQPVGTQLIGWRLVAEINVYKVFSIFYLTRSVLVLHCVITDLEGFNKQI